MRNQSFWHGKRVLITGHTGFKGAWLSIWLTMLGAKVTGYALVPPTTPSLFEMAQIGTSIESIIADIRNFDQLLKTVRQAQPEIVIHMAAQPLVRDSYVIPIETYSINVMGTVHVLEAVRQCGGVRAVVNVTTDKCYENKEWLWGYRESDPLGGYDPYSNSKACSELVTTAYRNSFFHPDTYKQHGVAVATARAGNVIGGGDWAKDRLIPDCINALINGESVRIRNPHAIRPWQHVIEPLGGYLLLAESLYNKGVQFSEGWNFGPVDADAKSVEWIVRSLCEKWGQGSTFIIDAGPHPHEATYLKLDCSKVKSRLGWQPKWNLETSLDKIVEWTRAYREESDLFDVCRKQILQYSGEEVKHERY